MSKVIAKCRKLVTLFHTSTSVNDKLMEKQKLLSEKVQGHTLIADVPTRWNSTLEMLKRILEQMPALMAVATDESVSKTAKTTIQICLLSFEETSLAEKAVVILEPFKKGTETLCSETNPTINKVIPVVKKLMQSLDNDEIDPGAIKALKAKMRKQMMDRTDSEDVAMLATILNPFTKSFQCSPELKQKGEELLMSFVNNVKEVQQVTVKKEKDYTIPELLALPALSEDMETDIIDTQVPQANKQPDEEIPVKMLKSADTEDWLTDIVCVGESRISQNDMATEEFRSYIGMTLKEDDKGLTVLEWWEKNEMFFPRLAVLAINILCIQASSVPSERVFSLAGGLVCKKRSRLSSDNIDLFIFLNKNMNKVW